MTSCAAANQYNGPMFYQNLENKQAWGRVVCITMGVITAAYTAVSVLGCTMYPGSPSELIFVDFVVKGKDDGVWNTMGLISMFLLTFSLIGSYPIASSALRNAVLEIIEWFGGKADRAKKGFQNTRVRRGIVVILYMIPVIAVTVWVTRASKKSASNAMTWSQLLVGNFLSFTFPGMMYYAAKQNKTMFEKIMIWTTIIAGPVFTVLGFIDFFMPEDAMKAVAVSA